MARVRGRMLCLTGTHSIMPCLAMTKRTVPTRWSSWISTLAASTTYTKSHLDQMTPLESYNQVSHKHMAGRAQQAA